MLKIIWDEPKRRANMAKHGIDFADVAVEFDFLASVTVQGRFPRSVAIGPFRNGIICAVIHFYGVSAISIVSVRPASNKERALYGRIKG